MVKILQLPLPDLLKKHKMLTFDILTGGFLVMTGKGLF